MWCNFGTNLSALTALSDVSTWMDSNGLPYDGGPVNLPTKPNPLLGQPESLRNTNANSVTTNGRPNEPMIRMLMFYLLSSNPTCFTK
ncbi:hypothetical protein ACTXT7_017354 [Hymenolepis weldensis]